MGRIFLVLVLLAVSLYVVKLVKTKLDEQPKKLKEDNHTDKENQNKMVKCLHCGLHIPEEEAIRKGDKVFCCLEHATKEL